MLCPSDDECFYKLVCRQGKQARFFLANNLFHCHNHVVVLAGALPLNIRFAHVSLHRNEVANNLDAYHFLCCGDYIVNSKTEVLEQFGRWRRFTEAVHADYRAVQPDILVPESGHTSLNSYTLNTLG